MTDRKKMLEIEREIKEAVALRNNPYSHNIIASCLREVLMRGGHKAANRLIEKYRLEAIFGFNKEFPA